MIKRGRKAEEYLKEYFSETNSSLENFLGQKVSEAREIGAVSGKIMEAFTDIALRGKRIRGALTVLGYEAAGGKDRKAILDASLFIELIHTGLLIHDDIQDNGDVRRGVPALHKRFSHISPQYGIAMGVNAGVSAYFLGIEKLVKGDFPEESIVRAVRITTEYVIRVTHGQALDVANIFVESANTDELLNILRYKSAEYTGSLPLLIGATLAGKKDNNYLSVLKEYGLCLGWAFQIQDDILGTFGDEEKLGKPVGSDIREGKVTLLMLHLAENGTKTQTDFQRKVLGKRDIGEQEIAKMQKILKESGSYDHVINLGWEYVQKGETLISKITKDNQLQEVFRSLLYFMMERTI